MRAGAFERCGRERWGDSRYGGGCRVGARVRPVARAVLGGARRRAPAPAGAGVRAGAPRPRRPEERRAAGRARGAGRLRPGAPLRVRLVLAVGTARARAGREGAAAHRRAARRADRRRHGVAQAGQALGGRRAPVRGRSRENDGLPDARLADARRALPTVACWPTRATASAPTSATRSRRAASPGRSASRARRRSTPPT
jgi:hypothetical protein